jgi:hypothetical protein
MDLQQFDSNLKSALDQLEVPYDPTTWAALESRLDALPAPDAVDHVLRPSLEQIESSYDAGSWFALANRMDTMARVRRLRMSKIAEAAIFLLLLLNLKGFFGVVESVTNPVPVKKEIPGPIAKNHTAKSKKQSATPANAETEIAATGGQSLSQQVVSFLHNLAANLAPDNETKTEETTTNTLQPIAANSSVLNPSNFYSQTGLVKFPIGPNLPARTTEQILFAGTPINIPGLQPSKVVRSRHLYAATYGSYDKNYLHEGAHSDKTTGYGSGMAVGYRKGKWGVETGIGYAQKSYQPKRQNVEYLNDPFNGIAFYYNDEVNADVFSVPVKVTRRVAKMGNTTAHAIAGVSAHFAANKRYDYKSVYLPPPIPVGPDPSKPATTFPEGKGVFEKGGLSNNAYATADLGLRVEQSLGKHYVAFVEPVYRQSLGGGLGPRASRLNTFSFQAGVMASL